MDENRTNGFENNDYQPDSEENANAREFNEQEATVDNAAPTQENSEPVQQNREQVNNFEENEAANSSEPQQETNSQPQQQVSSNPYQQQQPQDSSWYTQQPAGNSSYNQQPVDNSYNQQPQQQNNDIPYVDAQPYNPEQNSANPQQDFSPYAQNYYGTQDQAFNQNTQGTPVPPPVNKGKKKNKKTGFIVLASILVVAIVVGSFFIGFSYKQKASTSGSTSETSSDDSVNYNVASSSDDSSSSTTSTSGSLTAKQIAAKVSSTSVGVLLYANSKSSNSFGTTSSSSSSSSSSDATEQGTGIIWGENKKGTCTYILTCAHVISDAAGGGYDIAIQDNDGKQYDAELVGYDTKTDVGVVKINKTGLTAATFGSSAKLSVGEDVYAIGNPGGTDFFGSFTNGIVSAIDRPISTASSGYDIDCIQHTAAINSGNSGGALLNSKGQVVGINSSKIASTGYEAMGFAIPIDTAIPIANDLVSYGYVANRAKLGITYYASSAYNTYAMVVKLKDLPAGSLIIASISTKSALSGTKAQVGDLITAVDGKELDSADVLLDKIESSKIGDTLTLTIARIDSNYNVTQFKVKATLIADKGNTEETTTTTQSASDYWDSIFGNNQY